MLRAVAMSIMLPCAAAVESGNKFICIVPVSFCVFVVRGSLC